MWLLGPCLCSLFLEEGLLRKPQPVSHVVICAEGCGWQGHPEAGPHADGCRGIQDQAAPQPQAAAVPAARRQSPRLQWPLIHAQLFQYYCFPCFFLYLFFIGSLSYQEPLRLQQTSDSFLEGSQMIEKMICPSNSISSCCILATYLAAYCPQHQICRIQYKMLTMVSIPCLVFLPSSYAMVSIPCYSVI